MSVHHVALEVREQDADDEVAFWELLGFEEVDPPPALRERSRWVQKDATQIHLLFADAPVVPEEGHVAVICADYEAALARLPEADPRTEHWGSPRAFVRTPSGHRVELMQFRP